MPGSPPMKTSRRSPAFARSQARANRSASASRPTSVSRATGDTAGGNGSGTTSPSAQSTSRTNTGSSKPFRLREPTLTMRCLVHVRINAATTSVRRI